MSDRKREVVEETVRAFDSEVLLATYKRLGRDMREDLLDHFSKLSSDHLADELLSIFFPDANAFGTVISIDHDILEKRRAAALVERFEEFKREAVEAFLIDHFYKGECEE